MTFPLTLIPDAGPFDVLLAALTLLGAAAFWAFAGVQLVLLAAAARRDLFRRGKGRVGELDLWRLKR